jgi:hypothetical protein
MIAFRFPDLLIPQNENQRATSIPWICSKSLKPASRPADSLRKNQQVAPVPKLCQNPIRLGCPELPFEREQLPQVIDNRHFRMELM